MDIQQQEGALTVRDLRELNASNARSFCNAVCAAIEPGLETIEVDFSQTQNVDSCGLSALMSLLKAAENPGNSGSVTLRLLNPRPSVQQMIELTRMHRVFEVVLAPPAGRSGDLQSAASLIPNPHGACDPMAIDAEVCPTQWNAAIQPTGNLHNSPPPQSTS